MIAAFIFFAICLSDAETLTSHILYYGVAISFLFNGNGQWSRRQAKDASANIVIIGNSIAAVAAVQHLEKILPDASNVNVTLLSKRSDIQFISMLPEVVSGAVQPNTLINSLTKLFTRTRLILGDIKSINTKSKTVSYANPGGSLSTVGFDQLIVANDQKIDHDCESQTDRGGINYLGSVVDALELKQNLLRHFLSKRSDNDSHQRPMKIAIYGGGERGSALAMEIFGPVDSLKLERSIPWTVDSKIYLLESNDDRQNMSDTILPLRANKSVYECYMGRYSIATWHGLALPGAVGWLLNRTRCISMLPGLERKLRVIIDWALDFVFSNDTSGFLEHDYESYKIRSLQLVPPVEFPREIKTQIPPDETMDERRDGTTG